MRTSTCLFLVTALACFGCGSDSGTDAGGGMTDAGGGMTDSGGGMTDSGGGGDDAGTDAGEALPTPAACEMPDRCDYQRDSVTLTDIESDGVLQARLCSALRGAGGCGGSERTLETMLCRTPPNGNTLMIVAKDPAGGYVIDVQDGTAMPMTSHGTFTMVGSRWQANVPGDTEITVTTFWGGTVIFYIDSATEELTVFCAFDP